MSDAQFKIFIERVAKKCRTRVRFLMKRLLSEDDIKDIKNGDMPEHKLINLIQSWQDDDCPHALDGTGDKHPMRYRSRKVVLPDHSFLKNADEAIAYIKDFLSKK